MSIRLLTATVAMLAVCAVAAAGDFTAQEKPLKVSGVVSTRLLHVILGRRLHTASVRGDRADPERDAHLAAQAAGGRAAGSTSQ